VSEGPYFRCDYCGELSPLDAERPQLYRPHLYWVHADTLDDGREVCTTGIYCSEPCGQWSANRSGTSRG
jgi:hypothetical protein